MIYNIKPNPNFSEEIEAENADKAIEQFATNMDSNMNLYFKAIPKKDCKEAVSEDHNSEDATTQFEKLKTALFDAGTEAIESFLGYELGVLDDKEAIDRLMDDVIMQMPDDTFDKYYQDYVVGNSVADPEPETNPDLLADIYIAVMENGERKEYEYFDINNFFEDMNNDRLSFPKPSAELLEAKMNGKELYPADFAQLLLILGYEDNIKDDFRPNALIYFDCNGEECRFKSVKAFFKSWSHGWLGSNMIDDVRINGQKIKCGSLRELAEILDVDGDYAKERFEWDEQREIEEERNCTQEQSNEPYDLTAQDILSVLVASMPRDSSEFNSEYHGEPNHLMELPNGRTLKIIAGDSSDEEPNYTWVVVGSEIEQANNAANNCDYNYFGECEYVLAIETSDDFDYDTVYSELDWAIRIAKETPIRKKVDVRIGEEMYVPFGNEKTIAYVVDTDETKEVFTVCLTDKKKFHTIHFDSIEAVERTGRINDMITHLF